MSDLAAFLSACDVPHIAVPAVASADPIPGFIDIDGVVRPTKNSTGQLIHPTLEGIRNFWSWFGNSKMVDAHGRPVVYFHGVGRRGKFNEFRSNLIGASSGNEGHYGKGFYFAPSEEDALLFSNQWHGTGEVLRCYLRIESPFHPTNDSLHAIGQKHKGLNVPDKIAVAIDLADLASKLSPEDRHAFELIKEDDWDTLATEAGGKLYEHPGYDKFQAMQDLMEYGEPDGFRGVPSYVYEDCKTIGVRPKVIYGHKTDLRMEYLTETGARGAQWTQALKSEGHDGVVAGVEIVAFDSNQIKSADENNGDFSPSTTVITATEDITETIDVDGTQRQTRNNQGKLIHPTVSGIENFWRWFGDSRLVDAQKRPLVWYHGTSKNFDTFRPNAALGGLIFAAPTIDEAHVFAGNYKGSNVMPVYIKAVKPYTKPCLAQDEVAVAKRAKGRKCDAMFVHDSAADPLNIAVFSPNQIKSVTGNNGDFSSSDDRVTASYQLPLQ